MPRTAITPISPQQGAQLGSVSAGDLDVTMTALDAVNGNDVEWSSARLMVIAWNSDGANPYTMTITSLADSNGRSGDITAYSLAADDHAVAIFARDGWQQTDNTLWLDTENAAVKVAVVNL